MDEYARYGGPVWLAEKRTEASIGGNSMAWFLIGTVVGAATAVLLAPTTGRDLRSNLRNVLSVGYRRTIDSVSRSRQHLRRHSSNLIRFTRRSN